MNRFFETLKTQRWDDHRYYHQSRVNQSLHFISALSFLVSYAYVFIDPSMAALIAWLVAMSTRQAGHFFFEPQGFDEVNQVSHDHKEAIKVGYNLARKEVLIALCAGIPLLAWWMPQALTWLVPEAYEDTPWRITGMAWFVLGVAGLMFRVLQLWIRDGATQGLAWATKILTDPFHDIMLYHRSPLYLLQGQWLDPMDHVRETVRAGGAPRH